MRDEVEDAGTGSRAVVPGLKICGKTGTAQVANEHNQITDQITWFVSFAPYEKPRYAVVVMIESGRDMGCLVSNGLCIGAKLNQFRSRTAPSRTWTKSWSPAKRGFPR